MRYNSDMERMRDELLPEEVISRILGLPMERIEFMRQEYQMPVAFPAFSDWFIANPRIVLEELKKNFEQSVFPREFRPELAEPAT